MPSGDSRRTRQQRRSGRDSRGRCRRPHVNPELGDRLVAAEAEAARLAKADPLSEREREVLRLLAVGHTNQEIAKRLYISVRTVETHRAHVMQKLRLQTRADLVAYALERGLLESG
ncbi:MAG: response regulator transcription factor [Gaiellaceae bacterium]